MALFDHAELLNHLISQISSPCKNELQYVRHIQQHGKQNELQNGIRDDIHTLHTAANCSGDVKMQKLSSEQLRTAGNKLLANKKCMTAIRIYTDAIFAAPLGETLALAHANRGAALQEFGYYQQAYDDCVLALEHGYPEHLQHKIWCRQAYCSWKVGDLKLLQRHLNELDKKELNENFMQQVKQLRSEADGMQTDESTKRTKDEQSIEHITMHDALDVVVEPQPIGRHFIANRAIAKNEIICIERGTSFVKAGSRDVCENCAAFLIIPLPCKKCENRVVYCSLKCMREHQITHQIECAGIRMGLFEEIGVGHLATRIMLDGLPQIIPLLHQDTNIDMLWEKLVSGKATETDYSLTLAMTSLLNKVPDAIMWGCAYMSEKVLQYLKGYTNFFDCLKNVKWNMKKKELLIGSLIARHVAQFMINGFVITSLVPMRNQIRFGLFVDDVWCRPHHVKLGQLHVFSEYEETAAINFPYLSIANHACDPSFIPRFSGRLVTAYATKPLSAGDEIAHTYTDSHLIKRQVERRNKLANNYFFNCSCNKCVRESPDQDYDKFHQFRCEYNDCKKIFIFEFNDDVEKFTCSNCCRNQKAAWMKKFYNLLDCINNKPARRMLYNHFKSLDKWLIGYNTTKLKLAQLLITKFFDTYNAGISVDKCEFNVIQDIIQFNLDGTEVLYCVNSLQYVAKMTFLWDLIALAKCKGTKDEFKKMLQAVEIVSDEFKVIFMNYFDDYIKPQL